MPVTEMLGHSELIQLLRRRHLASARRASNGCLSILRRLVLRLRWMLLLLGMIPLLILALQFLLQQKLLLKLSNLLLFLPLPLFPLLVLLVLELLMVPPVPLLPLFIHFSTPRARA